MFNSAFGFAEMFGMTFAMMLWLPMLMIAAFLPVLLYLVARWRQQKAGVADEHLGIKCGLGVFRVISLQIVLAGVWLFVFSILADGDNEDLTRTAFGLILPGGIILGLASMLVQRTNDAYMPMPTRLFRGWEMVQTGLSASMALVVAFVITVQEDPPDEALKAMWSMVAVYGTAWGLMLRSLLDRVGGAAPMETVQRPVHATVVASGQATEPGERAG